MAQGYLKWFTLGMALLLTGTLKADDRREWINNSKSVLQIRLVPRKGTPEKGNLRFSRVAEQKEDPKNPNKKVPLWAEYGVLGENTAKDPDKTVLWGPGERISVEFTHTNRVFNHWIRIEPMDGLFTSLDVTLDQSLTSRTIEVKTPWTSLPTDAKGNLIYLLNTPGKGDLTVNDPGVKVDSVQKKAEAPKAAKANGPTEEDWKNLGLKPDSKPTLDDWKKILKTLRLTYHPDKVPGSATDAKIMEKATEDWNARTLSYNKIADYLGYPRMQQ